ncbi:MAG: glycosyltransferase, partial [Deltaproteobacteria bacterium]|nr:glycosyltransferase [Deltaproteobacteria bacterium]
ENDVKIIKNEKNLGFAKACNQGAFAAQSKYILFLNNDVKVNTGWLEPLISILDDDLDVAAVGSKLLFPDGTIQHAGVVIIDDRKLPDPLVGRHIHYRKEPDAPEANQRCVYQALTAACLLVRKSAFQEVGAFDEGYWNGYEDVDLCFKLQKNGGFLVYEPKSSAVHYESQSGPERFRQVSGNIRRLHQKWLGKIMPDIVIEADGKLRDSGAGKIAPYRIAKSINRQSGRLATTSEAFTSIIILAYNQLEYTKKCLESIFKYTKEPFELIVVDNGSTDGTVQYLEKLRNRYDSNGHEEKAGVATPKGRKKKGEKKKARTTDALNHVCEGIKVIKNHENLGFAAGNNQGISAARGNYILLMNNDVVVTPGWLGRLITCAERDQKIGIVGPMTNYVPGQQWVKEVTYNTTSLARLNKFSREFAGKYSGQRKHVLRVVGFCMLLKRAVIDKIGGMDDRYGLGNFEDDDFSLRATLGGFESWIAEDCFIHHFGSRTFIGSGIDYKESLSKNWEIFKHKWGMPQDIPYGSYNLSQIGRQSFDHERDYLPLVDKDTLAKDGQAVAAPQVESEIGRSDENQPTNVDNSVEASIIIFTSNQQKYLKRCIESIKKHTDEPHEVVFVDDGNAKGVLKWLRPIVKEKANYQLIKVDKNAGPAKCYNEGIGASSGEYILFLHNDVIVSDSWLSGMLGCLKRDSDIGIVSPMTHGTDGNRKNVAGDYPSVDNFDEYAKAFNKRNRHRQIPTKNVSEYCFVCKRNLIEKVGFFDEKVDSEKVAVEDFCMRANIEGYRNVIASDIIVRHYDSHKVTKRKKHGEIAGDRKLLLEKRRDMAANPVLGKRLLTLSAIEQADGLWQKDDIKGAFSVLAESIKKVPDEKGMYYALSKILIDAKQFKDALEVLNMMPPGDREVRKIELIGYCKEGMELYGETEEYVESAFSIDPGSALTLNLKGMVAYRQGDEKAAEAFFKMAVESNPGYGEPYANLGFMKWLAQQEDEAMDLFEKAFILTPTITDIFTNYHAAVKALGKYERAEQYFKDACNLYPKNKRLKYLLIDVLIQQEKHSMAMDEIQEAMIEFGMDEGMIAAALAVRNKLGPREIKSSSKNATISLCMIVKNEEQYLGKCLMNLNSVVDEMIVVDTGSTDRTKEISAIFGARVYDVEWTNDFSEARNYSISKASGDWIFVMDADETISPIDHEALRKLAEKRSPRPAAYSFVTRNYNMRTDIIGLNTTGLNILSMRWWSHLYDRRALRSRGAVFRSIITGS